MSITKHKFSKDFQHGDRVYKVAGSYDIKINDNANSVTGNQAGFSIEVSDLCGNFSGCGGVLGRKRAKELADRIYEVLERCTDTEEERLDSVYKQLNWRDI